MGNIKVDVERIVTNLGKNVGFLQPIYETITNSLEANASLIEIELFEDETLDETKPGLINGFSITDNGDGFNDFNLNGFFTLWTDNKITLGCKGSGRFTWLSVYRTIKVRSELACNSQNNVREFIFDKNFSENSVIYSSDITIKENKTIIVFSGLIEKYKKQNKDGQIFADLEIIKENILNYLSVKLFLLKRDGFHFEIVLKNKKEICTINWDDVLKLDEQSFLIKGIDDIPYTFTMFSRFIDNGKNSKRMYFCASNRCIKENDDDDLHFSCNLPNNVSMQMMVCSGYLDERNGDDRSTFEVLDGLKSANLLNPIALSQIKKESIKVMNQIIIDRFPEIIERNKEEVDKAIAEVPYLSKYIKENEDAVKSSKSLIKEATSKYEKEKAKVKTEFEKVLLERNINPLQFNEAVAKMSDVAAIELGEYILYRDSVIDGLKKGIELPETKEDFVHNVIIPKNTSSEGGTISEKRFNNIWLFDDKFMTFSYCASDKTIKQIVDSLYPDKDEIFRAKKRPDILLAFDNDDSPKKRNAVMVELKGPNADEDEKNKSITELPNHISIIRKNIASIDTIYGYIVTTIDESFKETLDNQDAYHPLFSKDLEGKAYYGYLKKVDAHIYILDLSVVLCDAKLRNKMFIDMIKQK